ncbi:MAG TPA: hypothetical protein VIM65_10085 [Cyclobacteriaceae bacterium]
MKILVVLILTLVTPDIFGQHQFSPLYYLNSEEIDIENIFINPSSIDEVTVDKKTERGSIYIKTKHQLIFLSLDDVLRTNSAIIDSAGQVVYTVNDKLIVDKSKVKVDASYFTVVDIKRLDKLNYIDERHRSLILVEIQLMNEQPKPELRIRGDEGLHAKK